MSATDDAHATPNALTALVQGARSGLRSDVKALIEALPNVAFMLPLVRPVPAVPVGQSLALDQAIELSPHFLPDASNRPLLPLFTYFGPLDRIVPSLGWQTDGGPLQLFTLPALQAFRVAYRIVDIWNVRSLVIDAGAASELVLSRDEISSILDAKPIPLVAYAQVGRPADAGVSELTDPSLVRAVRACLERHKEARDYRLERIFDPERDLRPRLLLRIWASAGANRDTLLQALAAATQPELPYEGELQVRFET